VPFAASIADWIAAVSFVVPSPFAPYVRASKTGAGGAPMNVDSTYTFTLSTSSVPVPAPSR
jgi:hypothetical protein